MRMKRTFIVNFNETVNKVKDFNVSDICEGDGTCVFRIGYIKNAKCDYIVTVEFNDGFVVYGVYGVNSTRTKIFENAMAQHENYAIEVASIAMGIIICDTNGQVKYYKKGYEYGNFKNDFCVIIPGNDEPYILEMHMEVQTAIYSVSGVGHIKDCMGLDEALWYFIDICRFDI